MSHTGRNADDDLMPHGSRDLCPACSAPLQLVWVHAHGQCANCATPIVPYYTGAGQEVDEYASDDASVTVDDVIAAFERSRDGGAAVTLEALAFAIIQHEECTQDAALAAIERAVALKRLAQAGRIVRLQA